MKCFSSRCHPRGRTTSVAVFSLSLYTRPSGFRNSIVRSIASMRLRCPSMRLRQVGVFASSKSAMYTEAPELSALITILRSVGPVISTFRVRRSAGTRATVHSDSRRGRESGRKSSVPPSRSSRHRSARVSRRPMRVGSTSWCRRMRKACASFVSRSGARAAVSGPSFGIRTSTDAVAIARMLAHAQMSAALGLEGKRALVTGGSRGMGRAIALALAEAGADVAVTSRNGDDAEPVAVALRAKGRRALALLLEVRNEASIRVCFERIDREWGSVDILVKNAGTNIPQALDTLDGASWDTVIDIDLKGLVFVTQAAAGRMIAARRGGRIVSIAAIYGVGGPRRGLAL